MDRTASLYQHLRYNHYPPVHEGWIPVCERAIDRAQRAIDADPWSVNITGKVRRPASHGGGLIPIVVVIEKLHLDDYLTCPDTGYFGEDAE